MGGKRLSKLQKWILVNCYRMTVLRDNTKLLPLSGRNAPDDRYVFFRDDILRSYFALKPSRRDTFLKVHHSKENKEYYSAQASLSRTLKNLHEKGYIIGYMVYYYVELTEKGKEKAQELSVKGWNSGEQPLTIRKNKDFVPFF
jgi:hypothetical protein